MRLKKAQNVITIIFLSLMSFNMIAGLSLYNKTDILLTYLKIYGVHLSIILTFYFSQTKIDVKVVAQFKLILILFLLIIWNLIIFATSISAADELTSFNAELDNYSEYTNILIAGGIVYFFNGNPKK